MQLPATNLNINHDGAESATNAESAATAGTDKKQLPKQESLDKISNASTAGGESRNPSNGALNLTSIADLEKKLAALRHADNAEEVKLKFFNLFILRLLIISFLFSVANASANT